MTPNPLTAEQVQCVTLIARIRHKGWTLEAIAGRLDVAITSVWRWEQAEMAHRHNKERESADGISFPHATASRRMLPILRKMAKLKARRVGK